jgi:5-formyltetrahydrofolate cyclo-ligase
MNDLQSAKQEMRAAALERRRQLARDAAPGTAERLAENFIARLLPAPGTRISGFWPLADEIDVRPLMIRLHDRGCQMSLPVVNGPGKPLEFRAWQPTDDLVSAKFGLREPAETAPVVTPTVVLTPLVAFDRDGNRLGFGRGYYDMTLAGLRAGGGALAVGIAFAGQLVAAVPHDDLDQRLDWMVTEDGVIEFGGGGRTESETA